MMRHTSFCCGFLIALSQVSAQTPPIVAGYYLPIRSSENPFSELWQLEIWKDGSGSYKGTILLDAPTIDSSITCSLQEISIQGKVLTFKADNCLGDRYEFTGEFLRSGMMDFLEGEVLRGHLSIVRDGVLIKEGTIGFEFSEGC